MTTIQKITVEIRIDGRIVTNVLEVSTSASFEQINAECTIWCVTRPSWAEEGADVTVWASNGTQSGQIFGGQISGYDWTYAPTKVGVVCQDLLARVREAWGGDEYEYTDQAPAAIIRNLLEKKAIPSSLANIEDSDILPNLGIVEPIVLKEGDTPYSIISDIDALDGYRTYTTPAGTIFRRRVGGQIGTSGALSFSKGVIILAGPRHNRTRIGIVNRAIVTGLTYEGLVVGGPGVGEASAANPFVTDPSGFITEQIQSNLVEDDTTALSVAQRKVLDKNRRPEYVEFSVPFDPRPQPAMTVQVTHSDLELSSALVFVQSVSHQISASGATTTIRAIGGALAGPSLQPPVAQFSVLLALEGEDTGSGVSALIVIIADGSTSYDPDGTIASYAWTASATGATPSPTSGSGAVFRCTLDGAATDITISLTVTDNDSQTGTLETVTPIDTSTMPVEDLYLAYGDVACSSDGEQTWKTATPASGSATCLSPIAPDYQAWGTDSGHIYATWDKLATDLIDLGQPHGAVACTAVWIHETDPTRLWAGFDDGKVYFGTVDTTGHTASWTLKGTIPEGPVREMRESYGTFGELRATAGQGYYYSADGGITWALQHTFDTAWRMAAGFDTNLASGLNDAAPLYDEDGTPPTLPAGVEHVRGLSFGYRVSELYAADDAANLYLGAAPSFDLSLHADTTPAIVNHMVRSGNIDRVVYMAVGDGTGDNGFMKWIPDVAAPFFIRRTASNAGLMIGYGSLHLPILTVTGELLIVDGGLLPADPAGVWHVVDGVWTHITGGGLANTNYGGIRANPFDPDEWIIFALHGNLVFHTDDAGATWTQISQIASDIINDVRAGFNDVAFSTTNSGHWMAVGHGYDLITGWKPGWVWKGTHASVDDSFSWSAHPGFGSPAPVNDALQSIECGPDGSFVAGGAAFGDPIWPIAFYGIPASATSYTDFVKSVVEDPGVHQIYTLDTQPGTRTTVGAFTNNPSISDIPWTPDYMASDSGDLIGGSISTIHATAAATAAGFYIGYGSGGLYLITGLPSSSTLSEITAIDTYRVHGVRSDRQTKTLLGVFTTNSASAGVFYIYDGAAWSTIPVPADMDDLVDSRFPPKFEVIGRR